MCLFLKVMEQTKLIKEFLNKGWGLLGLNKLLKKLQETSTMAILSGSIKSI